MTISYDDALRDRVRAHLAAHDRRAVTDPSKRHAAVAVVLTTSESKSLGPSLLQGGRLHHVLPLATPTVRSHPSLIEV